jgi:hypothetical protein
MKPGSPTLDLFIPQPDVRERHEILIQAPAPFVLDVARRFDLQSAPLVRVIFWLRAKALGANTPVRERPKGLLEELMGMGWGILAEEPGHLLIAGAVCQPWKADVVFDALPPGWFPTFSTPGYVKIAWTLQANALGPDLTQLVTETRAAATDDQARRKFRRYWRVFGPGAVAIRRLLLTAVRRQAEGRWRAEAGSSSTE